MKDRRRAALQVGIAVLVATVGLIVGLGWVKQWSLKHGTYSVFARYPDVGGLGEGDPVWVSGVEMGRVAKVDLLGREGVEVELRLQDTVVLYDDSMAIIRGAGLMGERFVAIQSPGQGQRLAPGGRIKGVLEAGPSELMAESGATIAQLRMAAERVNRMLAFLEDGKLEQTVRSIGETAEQIGAIASENREDLRSAVTSFRDSARRMKTLVDSHADGVDTTLTTARAAADRLDRLSMNLEQITARIDRGEGTLGKLINDQTLHDDLRRTVAAADTLIRDLREHPGRYLRFSVF